MTQRFNSLKKNLINFNFNFITVNEMSKKLERVLTMEAHLLVQKKE